MSEVMKKAIELKKAEQPEQSPPEAQQQEPPQDAEDLEPGYRGAD